MRGLIDCWDRLCEFVRSLFEPEPERPRRRPYKRLSFEVLEERTLLTSTLSIGDAYSSEGSAYLDLLVYRSGDPYETVSVSYQSENGTAAAGSDYTAVSGNLTFNPGVMTLPIQVPVLNDLTHEELEEFFVNLSNATGGAIIGDSKGQGTIGDNDPSPAEFSIADATVDEDFGTVQFQVSLSNPCRLSRNLCR
ncbi:MAG: hypothetical protein HYS13_24595 [Planctomycetia bacterium]|nr:hypothetical protein [Planctomycetia bacterium]